MKAASKYSTTQELIDSFNTSTLKQKNKFIHKEILVRKTNPGAGQILILPKDLPVVLRVVSNERGRYTEAQMYRGEHAAALGKTMWIDKNN